MRFRYSTILALMESFWEVACKNPEIKKPMAYTIYRTWQIIDEMEPERVTLKDILSPEIKEAVDL